MKAGWNNASAVRQEVALNTDRQRPESACILEGQTDLSPCATMGSL